MLQLSAMKTLVMMPAAVEAPSFPSANSLVAQARQRLAHELAAMPSLDGDAPEERLRAHLAQYPASFGALVHLLRAAMRARDLDAARDLFVLLLGRIEGLNRRWAQRAVVQTPSLRGGVGDWVREDLRQELTLHLWEQLALGSGEKWELFFQRSLDYAQRHTATTYMEQRGYWTPPDVTLPARRGYQRCVSITQLIEREGAWPEGRVQATQADLREHFSAAELSDLRSLVLRLPPRQRMVIVMRYWQRASEAEIAEAIGVTTRTMRSDLRKAQHSLREWYAGAATGETVETGERA